MDKLRAIEYFNRAAEVGTFAAAARSFDVSTPAVTQLVAALERSMGTLLFHRSNRGLTLTADGERYYAVSRALTTDLNDLEQQLATKGGRLRGTLTIGMRGSVAQHCVAPYIRRFLERHPGIELVLTPVDTLDELEARNVDVALMTGWPPDRDFVVRQLVQTRNLVCASPEYWQRRGKPQRPTDLLDHECLVMQSSGGTLLDRWTFEKNGERETVNVRSRVLSFQVTWIQEAACAGAGVVRLGDLILTQHIATGLLEPVLTDWEALEAPSHFVVYRPSHRRSKLVRAFVDFLVELFEELAAHRVPGNAGDRLSRMPRPEWFGRARGRQSAFVTRGRV